ncbi:MAG: TetR/AcrR family transcriptional regulator [Bifidobacteriaceae bacterium]|nr:TetR/AcrR family transcriptional regulator [Bifidobacteriaceae bacterium]
MKTQPIPQAALREESKAATQQAILAVAAKQHAEGGPKAVSPHAIARELRLAPSVVLRLFPTRDAVITGLLIQGYSSLGNALAKAEAAVPRSDLAGRVEALFLAERTWALHHPSTWALLYGLPVPDYLAPSELIGPASAFFGLMLGVFDDAGPLGLFPPTPPVGSVLPPPGSVASAQAMAVGAPDWLVATAIGAWEWVIGAISAELWGHLVGVVDQPEALYRAGAHTWVQRLGLA